jgi:hypothetical protein
MSTDTKPQPVTGEIVWSCADDSHLTDKVIKDWRESRAELEAAMAECRAARAER